MSTRTTIRIRKETHVRLIKTRGRMEADGKRRTIDNVINELIDVFETENLFAVKKDGT